MHQREQQVRKKQKSQKQKQTPMHERRCACAHHDGARCGPATPFKNQKFEDYQQINPSITPLIKK